MLHGDAYLWLSNWNCQYGQMSLIPDIQGSDFFRRQRTFLVNEKKLKLAPGEFKLIGYLVDKLHI